MSRGEIMTSWQGRLHEAQASMAEAAIRQFPVGSSVVVVDGAGRRMPSVVRFHGTGDSAGYLSVMPANNKGRRRSLRSVHWSQIELEGDHD